MRMGRDECTKLLRMLMDAVDDPTGMHELAVVETRYRGEECSVLCIITRDKDRVGFYPLSILLSDEEANQLENPLTGQLGLPWLDENKQQKIFEPN